MVDPDELEYLTHVISVGEAALPVVAALGTLLLDDGELCQRLDDALGHDVWSAVLVAERALAGTIARRRYQLAQLQGGGADA